MVTVCPSQFATRRTLFHVLVGCGLLMLKVSRLKRSEERFSRNAETDLVCRLLLEKKKPGGEPSRHHRRPHPEGRATCLSSKAISQIFDACERPERVPEGRAW